MFGSPTSPNSKINQLAIIRRLAEHSRLLVEAKAAIGTERIRVGSISALMTDSVQRALTLESTPTRRRSKRADPLVEEAS
jgi:hypothetical protein